MESCCGQYLCDQLYTRGISSVLSNPLLFDLQLRKGEAKHKHMGDEVSTSLPMNYDLNSFLWKELEPFADQLACRFSLSEMKRSAVSRQHRDLHDSEHLHGGAGGSKLLSAADVYERESTGEPGDYEQTFDDGEEDNKGPRNAGISNGDTSMNRSNSTNPILISDSDRESGHSRDHSGDDTVLDQNESCMIAVCRGWALEKKTHSMFDMVRMHVCLLCMLLFLLNCSCICIGSACSVATVCERGTAKKRRNSADHKILPLA